MEGVLLVAGEADDMVHCEQRVLLCVADTHVDLEGVGEGLLPRDDSSLSPVWYSRIKASASR